MAEIRRFAVRTPISSTVLMLLLGISGGMCLECFQCNSYQDASCTDIDTSNKTLREQYLLPCADIPAPFCRKLYQKFTKNGDERTTRYCGWVTKSGGCRRYSDDEHEEESCECSSDACNAAPASLRPWGAVLTLTLIASLWCSYGAM